MASLTTLVAASFLPLPSANAGGSNLSEPSGTLTVFAASSLKEAMTGIGAGFERTHRKVSVIFEFAGSSTLVTQVLNGAPADVVATANSATMAQLVDGHYVDPPQTFAHNRLAIAIPIENQKRIRILADLKKPRTIIAVCQPQVPCGSAANAMFAAASLRVQPTTFEPDVKSVLTKVELGAVDAGVVYNSDIVSAGKQIGHVRIPDRFNPPIAYPIASVSSSKQIGLKQAFIDFVLSSYGKRQLQKSGFLP